MSSCRQTCNMAGNNDSGTFFPVEPVPRLSIRDPEALRLISAEKPVVLTDAHLCDTALKWNLDYLQQHIGSGKHVVFASKSNVFKYYDELKVRQLGQEFERPTERLEITFQEFVDRLKQWKPGLNKLYLQQGLNSSVGPAIAADFVSFNWSWLTAQQKAQGWGPLTSNLLLVGMAGNTTPVHYDEQQNFFCQLIGYKRCLLFAPDHHDRLYPHPVYHPHDRQSQVDLSCPDFERFPGLRQLSAQSTVLGPGEVLYIPIYWWHHITSLHTHPYTVSVNFWYKGAATDTVSYPLSDRQKVAITRNIEKMIVDALKEPHEVDLFFQSLTLGRYTAPRVSLPPQLSTSIASRLDTAPTHNSYGGNCTRSGVMSHAAQCISDRRRLQAGYRDDSDRLTPATNSSAIDEDKNDDSSDACSCCSSSCSSSCSCSGGSSSGGGGGSQRRGFSSRAKSLVITCGGSSNRGAQRAHKKKRDHTSEVLSCEPSIGDKDSLHNAGALSSRIMDEKTQGRVCDAAQVTLSGFAAAASVKEVGAAQAVTGAKYEPAISNASLTKGGKTDSSKIGVGKFC